MARCGVWRLTAVSVECDPISRHHEIFVYLCCRCCCWGYAPGCVCVCVSQTLFQREVNFCRESFHDVSCRGTQEAHRAVSNEALYGVFRISGLITLTYLHLWNCWQAVLIPCFPALGPRTLSPHTIIIAFNQFLSRSFLFSLFNCFKTGVSQVFFNFGSVP